MSYIYKNAAHVVVSLGEANSESDAAMDSIYPLVRVMSRIDRLEPPEFEQ